MTSRSWSICVLLAVLAAALVFGLGLDLRHCLIIVAAAFLAGAGNVLLEAITSHRRVQPDELRVERGLGDIQALAFSLSTNRAVAGSRALFQLHHVARRALALRGLGERDAGSALRAALAAHRNHQNLKRPLYTAAVGELEDLISIDLPLQAAKPTKGHRAP